MSGYFRVDPELWEEVRADLLERAEGGDSFSREAAILDLRYLEDRSLRPVRPKPIPCAAELGRWWGWGEKRARLLLARENEWRDPWRGRNEDGPRTDRGRTEGGTGADGDAGERRSSHTGAGSRANGGRVEEVSRPMKGRRARGEADPDPSPSPDPDQAPPVPGWEECAERWAEISGTPNRLRRSKGLGLTLATRVRESGAPAVLAVLDWFKVAPDRAAFLRDNNCGLKTLMRAGNFEEYLGMAEAWTRGGRKLGETGAPALKLEGERAWTWLLGQIAARPALPDRLVGDSDKEAALQAGISAVGGIGVIRRASSRDGDDQKRTFVAAYVAKRGKP